MKISELVDMAFLSTDGVENSHLLINYAPSSEDDPLSCQINIDKLADAIAAKKKFVSAGTESGPAVYITSEVIPKSGIAYYTSAPVEVFDPLTYSIPINESVNAFIPFLAGDEASGEMALFNGSGDFLAAIPPFSNLVWFDDGVLVNSSGSIDVAYLDNNQKVPVSNLPGEVVTFSNGEITTLSGNSVPVDPPAGTIVYNSSTHVFTAVDGNNSSPITILKEDGGFLETGSESQSWTIPLSSVVIYACGALMTAAGDQIPVKFEEA